MLEDGLKEGGRGLLSTRTWGTSSAGTGKVEAGTGTWGKFMAMNFTAGGRKHMCSRQQSDNSLTSHGAAVKGWFLMQVPLMHCAAPVEMRVGFSRGFLVQTLSCPGVCHQVLLACLFHFEITPSKMQNWLFLFLTNSLLWT